MKGTLRMNKLSLSLTICLAIASSLLTADQPKLDPHLEPLRPWLNQTFKAEGKAPNSDKPYTDVCHWERALNGKAVRTLHSINDGAYGGECIVSWDAEKQAVTYYYFTTDSFRTEGTMTFQEGKILTHEFVKGNAEGISEVRGIIEIRSDGAYLQKSEYFKDGKWTPGREALYRPDPGARIVFK
jgi:hypothetical protein